MGDHIIKGEPKIKILGVILDQSLKYREHISKARDKEIKAALALKQLKNLRSKITKKLFYSKVTSITDYALQNWRPAAVQYTINRLEKVQRIETQAIKGAFSTISLLITESKALLAPIQARLH